MLFARLPARDLVQHRDQADPGRQPEGPFRRQLAIVPHRRQLVQHQRGHHIVDIAPRHQRDQRRNEEDCRGCAGELRRDLGIRGRRRADQHQQIKRTLDPPLQQQIDAPAQHPAERRGQQQPPRHIDQQRIARRGEQRQK